jgi:glycosyl transferase family 25
MKTAEDSLGVFVVSMPTALERRVHMQQELGQHGIAFTFFDALNGQQAEQALRDYGLRAEAGALSPGELGCALSHITLWLRLLASPAQVMTVLEDDVFLGRDAQIFLCRSDWLPTPPAQHLVKIEKYQEAVLLGPAGAQIKGRSLHPLRSDHWGTVAYVLGRTAAQELLDALARAPLNQAIDHFMFEHFRELAPQSVWQLNPAVCIQEVIHGGEGMLGSSLVEEREARQEKEQSSKISFLEKQRRLFRFSYWKIKYEKLRYISTINFV